MLYITLLFNFVDVIQPIRCYIYLFFYKKKKDRFKGGLVMYNITLSKYIYMEQFFKLNLPL